MADLELHGTPGRALNAALDAARLDLASPGPPPILRADGEGVGVNATLPSLGPAAVAEAARQSVESGFSTLKLKAGAERETEVLVERVREIRLAVGPDVRLRLDVNGAWDLATAEDRLEAVARFDIEFVEQPLPAHDLEGLATLRRRVTVPIAADEAASSVAAVRDLLAAEAVDVLVVKPARVGGPAAAAEIAERAAARGVPVVVSTLFETGVGIAAALAVAAGLPVVAGTRWEDELDHGLATAGLLEHDLLDGIAPGRRCTDAGPRAGWQRRPRDRARRPGARALPDRRDRIGGRMSQGLDPRRCRRPPRVWRFDGDGRRRRRDQVVVVRSRSPGGSDRGRARPGGRRRRQPGGPHRAAVRRGRGGAARDRAGRGGRGAAR